MPGEGMHTWPETQCVPMEPAAWALAHSAPSLRPANPRRAPTVSAFDLAAGRSAEQMGRDCVAAVWKEMLRTDNIGQVRWEL